MKKPHFYCLESNIGTINYPYGTTEDNSGVADGCRAILSDRFLDDFSGASIHSLKFTDHSFANESEYFQAIARQYDDVSKMIKDTLDAHNELPVVVGGDHGVSYSAIGSILEREGPDDIKVIMFDSHADLASRADSPSGNFHGMWVRPLIDRFDVDAVDKKIPRKISPKNWMYVGDLEGEPYFDRRDMDFIKERGVGHISKAMLAKNLNEAKNIFENFLNDARRVYITFDVDVYHQGIAPATGITGKWGLDNNAIPIFLKAVADSGKLAGVDVTEVNPQKEGADKTIRVAQDILLRLLKN